MKEILFIHDQLENPWVRQHFLESSGYRVHSMTNGNECMERFAVRVPDLLLMDVLIEGKNGFEVCRLVRRNFSPADLPIILCSEIYRSRLFRDEAITAGAQRYLLKPMRLDELVREVNEVLAHTASKTTAA